MASIMAHFAKVNKDNIVEQVIVVSNDVEKDGQKFINKTLKLDGTWIQTSYSGSFRGKYAGIGDIYDPVNDLFYSETPVIDDSETV
jgi:hypothetical protein